MGWVKRLWGKAFPPMRHRIRNYGGVWDSVVRFENYDGPCMCRGYGKGELTI